MKNLFLLSAVVLSLSVRAIELGTPFSDGAVLQRNMRVPVWGVAEPSSHLSVLFAGQKVETSVGENGAWRVDLEPMNACSDGRDLVVVGQKGDRVVIHDVLVGEVWFCAGQSNMEAPLWGGSMHFADAKGGLRGTMTRKPLVRYCLSTGSTALVPQRKLAQRPVWKRFVPENLGAECFSAVGFYFALELHNALGIPVGVVGAYWGGTPIVAWTPKAGLASVEYTRESSERELEDEDTFRRRAEAAKAEGVKWVRPYHYQPTIIFNSKVAPFTPMAMRGLVWYQGETDGGRGTNYVHWLHAFYNGWSTAFENPALKMRFTQLAPAGGDNLARIMEGQAAFAHEEANAKMTVISDRGAIHDWHPTDKETVGMRLAALALRHDYGWSDVKPDAPTLRDWKVVDGKFVLSFDHAEGWFLYNEDWSNDNLFEVVGTNGVWQGAIIDNMKVKERQPYKSSGQVVGKDLIVFSPEIREPIGLRYHYQKPQVRANLFNEIGLPLGPFHVDVR